MTSPFDGIDMSDPCSLWPKLQEVYDRLIAGEMVVKSRFGDDEREWQRSNSGELKDRIRQLKAQCARKCGEAPSRRALTFGW